MPHGGLVYQGEVVDIGVGDRTAERLHAIRYEDRGLQHFTLSQVQEFCHEFEEPQSTGA